MTRIWSSILWSRYYCLMRDGRIQGYIDVNTLLSADMVEDVVTLSAILSIRLPEDLSPALRESVQTTLLRYGSLQSYRDGEPIVIAVGQDPWGIREHVDCNLREAVYALGFNLIRIPRQHAIGMMKMTHVMRFFQRAPHLMMLAQSQVARDRACGSLEVPFPWAMVLENLSVESIQVLVTWIGASKEGRYDALLSTMAQGVTILTSWDQARP